MSSNTQKKHLVKTVGYGVLTAGLYAGFFTFADSIAANFARGAFWAAGPIATVFVVSYAHGNFASSLWSALGLEGNVKRKDLRAAKQPAVRTQIRATLNA